MGSEMCIRDSYEGTQVKLNPIVYDEANLVRNEVVVSLKSSNPRVASIDGIGTLVILKTGKTNLSASVDSLSTSFELTAIKNPARSLSISADRDIVRTGDVLSFDAIVFDRGNKIIEDAPIQFSYQGKAEYGNGLSPSAQITPSGQFVAETEGIFPENAGGVGISSLKKLAEN